MFFVIVVNERVVNSKCIFVESLPLIDFSERIWCLERNDLKSSLTTSFALSYECITHITLRVHYTLFINVFRRNNVNCNC